MEFWLACFVTFHRVVVRRSEILLACTASFFLISLQFVSASPINTDKVVAFSEYHQRLWDTRSHLPQISAISIAEDPRGYIWVATEGGLARFDGNHFEVFDGSISPLFADPLLRKVFVAPDGVVWVGTTDRLITICTDNHIREITFADNPLGRIDDIVWFEGAIYAGGDALYRIDVSHADKSKSHSDEAVTRLPVTQVTALTVKSDELWVATDQRLLSIGDARVVQEIDLASLEDRTHITSMALYENRLVLGTTSGLMQLDDYQQLSSYKLNALEISDSIELTFADSYGNLWVAGNQRLLQIVKDQLVEEISEIDGKTAPWFVTGFEDRWGDLWFGSRTHGIQRLRFDGTRRLGEAEGLAESYIWTFTHSKNGILVGTNRGLFLYANKRFAQVVADNRLPNKVVYSLFTDSNEQYWVGTRAGLVLLNADFSIRQSFPMLDNHQINSIAEGDDGAVWIATLGGLFRWKDNALQNMTAEFELGTVNIRYVFFDDKHTLWIGTARGVYQFTHGKARLYTDDKTLSETSVSYIGQLSDGRIVIGTFQSGFAVKNADGWRWMTPDLLPAAGVMFMAEDSDKLVVSTLRGVYQMSKQSLTMEGRPDTKLIIDDYGQEADADGIRCCNGAGSGRGISEDNYLYLPTLNNVARLDLKQALTRERPLSTVVESLKTRNKQYFSGEPELPIGVRNVQFRYTTPLFYRNSALTFRYRLVGYDPEWTNVGGRREAFYTNLPKGNYTFEVQSRLKEQNQWSEGATFQFSIMPFWYEQPWMRFLFLIAGMFVLWGFFYVRTLRLQRAKQRLEDVVQSRTRELDAANQQLAEANSQLKKASLTDALTGLNNRRSHDCNIKSILDRAERQQGVYAVLLDIDNFKALNDTYGHAVGDEVLMTFSKVLQQRVAYNDHLIRWGGEEFLIILNGNASPAEFITGMTTAMQQAPWPAAIAKSPPTCSVGICFHAPVQHHKWVWQHTLVLADKAMYLVKRQGKDGWLLLSPDDHARDAIADAVIYQAPDALLTEDALTMRGSAHVIDALKVLSAGKEASSD